MKFTRVSLLFFLAVPLVAQSVNPATDIRWPSCGTGTVYSPSTNTCVSTIPSGMIAFIASGSCPSGWSENDALTGYNPLITSTANADVGGYGASTLSAAAQSFAGASDSVSFGIISFAGASDSVSFGSITFTGSLDTTSATSGGTPAGTVAAPTFTGSLDTTSATSGGTPAGTNGATATTGNCAATNIAAGTGSTNACKATAPNITVPAEAFTGSALATHTHTVTPTGTVSIGTSTVTPTGTVSIGTSTVTPTGTNSPSVVSGVPAFYKLIACQKD